MRRVWLEGEGWVEEYDLADLVPLPAICPRCRRAFVGREAILAPSLANVCCFWCGPSRAIRLQPHPDYPGVVDARTRAHAAGWQESLL